MNAQPNATKIFTRRRWFYCLYTGIMILVGMGLCERREISSAEPWRGSSGSTALQQELHAMLANRASTAKLAAWAEGVLRQGRLLELGNDVLPWTTWTSTGWRRERILDCGQRIVLATDGMVLVAIREGHHIEFSVHDLIGDPIGFGQLSGRGTLLAEGQRVQHVRAASAADLARKSPKLFPIYYYFAGPAPDIVSTRVLPRPPLPLDFP